MTAGGATEPGLRPQPTILVIFGAAGDLTWRKLVPALYNLSLDGWLPQQFAVLGIDGKPSSDEQFAEHLRQGINQFSRRGKTDDEPWKAFASRLTFMSGDFADQGFYTTLADWLAARDRAWEAQPNRVFYLATPPTLVEGIAQRLAGAGLTQNCSHCRIVVEKPFGRDRDSARALNAILSRDFNESQIYRIDHYLGKETVQNMLALRFANALFEPIWNRRYIDHVQVTVAEEVGVEHRGGYYDHAGALRDMVQNHLLQLLCLVAMEPPVSFDADEIRNKKVDVLRAMRPIGPERVHEVAVRGQYAGGWIEGKRVAAYCAEPGVAKDSTTDTFAAVKFFVDNWRWQDVPFYVRTGKRLPTRVSEVSIQFRPVPHQSFPATAFGAWQANRLMIQIQPEEGILLRFQAKLPGPIMRLAPVDMQFRRREAFKAASPDAYETLLLDVMMGDSTLFMRADQAEVAWSVIGSILEVWDTVPPADFPNYPAGTWGPEAAEALIARDGRSWLLPTTRAESESDRG